MNLYEAVKEVDPELVRKHEAEVWAKVVRRWAFKHRSPYSTAELYWTELKANRQMVNFSKWLESAMFGHASESK